MFEYYQGYYIFMAWFFLSCFLAPLVGVWMDNNKHHEGDVGNDTEPDIEG